MDEGKPKPVHHCRDHHEVDHAGGKEMAEKTRAAETTVSLSACGRPGELPPIENRKGDQGEESIPDGEAETYDGCEKDDYWWWEEHRSGGSQRHSNWWSNGWSKPASYHGGHQNQQHAGWAHRRAPTLRRNRGGQNWNQGKDWNGAARQWSGAAASSKGGQAGGNAGNTKQRRFRPRGKGGKKCQQDAQVQEHPREPQTEAKAGKEEQEKDRDRRERSPRSPTE